MKPTMLVVEMRNKSCLLAASRNLKSIGGNANMNYRGASNCEGRSRGRYYDWCEDY